MHSLRSVCDVFAEASLVSHWRAAAHRLSVCWRSKRGRPGLVWPRCSKVRCCFVWIRWLEGQTVSVSYSSPPPTPVSHFALIGLCLLFGSCVFAEHRCCVGLQHFTQQSREVRGQKPWNSSWMGAIVLKQQQQQQQHGCCWSSSAHVVT